MQKEFMDLCRNAGLALEQLFARLAESVVSGSRSTALKPLLGLDALLAVTTVASCAPVSGVPRAIQIGLFVITTVCIAVTIGAYFYFMFRNPDYLRSERFSLQKMAIERGIVGDNLQGIITERRQTSLSAPEPVVAIEHGVGKGDRP